MKANVRFVPRADVLQVSQSTMGAQFLEPKDGTRVQWRPALTSPCAISRATSSDWGAACCLTAWSVLEVRKCDLTLGIGIRVNADLAKASGAPKPPSWGHSKCPGRGGLLQPRDTTLRRRVDLDSIGFLELILVIEFGQGGKVWRTPTGEERAPLGRLRLYAHRAPLRVNRGQFSCYFAPLDDPD